MSLYITHHARARAKKRLKGRGEIECLAEQARGVGLSWEAARGRLRRYLLQQVQRSEQINPGAAIRVHAGCCFVFHGERLLTCWRVPPYLLSPE